MWHSLIRYPPSSSLLRLKICCFWLCNVTDVGTSAHRVQPQSDSCLQGFRQVTSFIFTILLCWVALTSLAVTCNWAFQTLSPQVPHQKYQALQKPPLWPTLKYSSTSLSDITGYSLYCSVDMGQGRGFNAAHVSGPVVGFGLHFIAVQLAADDGWCVCAGTWRHSRRKRKVASENPYYTPHTQYV